MPDGRGPTGSVRGIPEEEATGVLVEVVRRLRDEAEDGRTYERSRATHLLRVITADAPYGENQVQGLLLALDRMVGVEHLPEPGMRRLPHAPVGHARHRLWSISLGRVRASEAAYLRDLLKRCPPAELGDNLRRLVARLDNPMPTTSDNNVSLGLVDLAEARYLLPLLADLGDRNYEDLRVLRRRLREGLRGIGMVPGYEPEEL